MVFSVQDATLITVAGLAIKEFFTYIASKKIKKANGQDRVSLGDIKGDIGHIKTAVSDIPVIKEKIDGINLRCKTHLESQAAINSHTSEEITKLEDKFFDHVKDGR